MERTPHILVVDDDREIRDLLGRFLVKHGLRVSTAADGREMHACLKDNAIDLIFAQTVQRKAGHDGVPAKAMFERGARCGWDRELTMRYNRSHPGIQQ